MHHLGRSLEDDTAPSLHIGIGLQLLFGGKYTVPQVLQCGLVFAESDDAGNVGHGTADEGGLEEGLRGGRVAHLEEGEVDIALVVLGEVALECFMLTMKRKITMKAIELSSSMSEQRAVQLHMKAHAFNGMQGEGRSGLQSKRANPTRGVRFML